MATFYRDPVTLAAALERATQRHYTVGLDLGQTTDPSAVAVLERLKVPQLALHERVPETLPYETHYRIRHLERLPLRSSYPAIVDHVGRMLATAPLAGQSKLVIDQTGVGRPVFDMFKGAGLRPVGITITAGDSWGRDGDSYRVSKLLLVSRLQAALHSGMLQISAALPEASALRSELADFRVNYTATGYSQFGAREGRHDDLVLAVSIALWHQVAIGGQKAGMGRWVI